MTREEFEQRYAERSGLTVTTLRGMGRIVRPCRCEAIGCDGWQSINRESAEENDRVMPGWDGDERETAPVD